MSKSDPIEKALHALGELRTVKEPGVAERELATCLRNRSNLVAAKAAKIAGELQAANLIPDLVAAFGRFMADPQRLDKRCAAVTEIVSTLYAQDYREPEVYLKGLKHVQKEASFGPPVDTAAALRGICAQGLLRTHYRDAMPEVVSLLVDPEPPARLGAIRALSTNGGGSGVLLLRLKVLTGDAEPEIMAECFAGLLAAGAEQSVPFVAKYIDAEDEAIAEAAIWALGESRLPASFVVLEEKWGRTVHRPTRKLLLLALAALRLEESISFLLSLLDSANSQMAPDVVAALAIYRGNHSITEAIATAVRARGEKALLEAFERAFEI